MEEHPPDLPRPGHQEPIFQVSNTDMAQGMATDGRHPVLLLVERPEICHGNGWSNKQASKRASRQAGRQARRQERMQAGK